MTLYSYPQTNDELVDALKLEPHPEGGFFFETGRAKQTMPSPFVDAQRNLHTTIYYLLTATAGAGKLHKHDSDAWHFHHCGRARFTLIYADGRVEDVLLGENAVAGELRQILVPAGTFKAIQLPEADLNSPGMDPARTGCLMSEVVVPGFDFADHVFPTVDDLRQRLAGHAERDELLARLGHRCAA